MKLARRRPAATATLASILSLLTFPLRAQQAATATLGGSVVDAAGTPVSGCPVELTSAAQGTTRRIETQPDGRFVLSNVDAGQYGLAVRCGKGFADVRETVNVAVGQQLDLPLRMTPATKSETVQVEALDRMALETVSSVAGDVVSARQIETLPLNGRNYLELAFLVPGNAPAPNFDPTKVHTVVVSSAGQVGRGGNVTIDGADNNDDVVGGSLVNIPEDAVQEFQVASNRYSAVLGRSGSSVTNVVTKQGSNQLHGAVGIYERDKVLQGLPATYDRGLGITPPFHRQQYVGDLGGPIRRDKAWWFAAIEDRQQLGADLVGVRNLTSQTITRRFAGSPLHDFLATERLDWQLTPNDRVSVRDSLELEDDLSASQLDRSIGTAAYRQTAVNHLHSIVADWVHTFRPSLLNRLSFSENNFINTTAPTSQTPQITFPDLDDGATYRDPQETRQFRLQFDDAVSWSKGAHQLTFGGQGQAVDADFFLGVFRQGNIQAVEDFPDFDRNGDGKVDDNDLLFAVALRSSTPDRALNLPSNGNTHLGFFAQDDWKARKNLALNLGLRWEMDSDLNNLSWYANRNPIVDSFYHGSRHRDYANFAPRVGFNYGVTPRMNVHGGYGIYYDRIVLEVVSLEKGFDGRALALNVTAGNAVTDQTGTPAYLNPDGTFRPGAPQVLSSPFSGFLFAGAGNTGIDIIDNRLRNPMVQQFNLGIQQEVAKGFVFTADGVHNLGTRFIIGRPVGSVLNPATGGPDTVTNLESSVNTKYDALWVSVRKQFDRFGEVNAAYTLAKAYNYANDDQVPFAYSPIDPNNLHREYGPPPNDQRHRLALSGLANLPLRLQFSPIWTIGSGVPMDILMPDGSERVPTLERNAGGRRFHNAAELNAFIQATNTAGGIVEQTSNGPQTVLLPEVSSKAHFNDSFNALDFRLSRDFHISDRVFVRAFGEAFNIFNVTNILGTSNLNYSGFNNALSPDSKNPAFSSSFGQPVSTAGGVFGSGGPRAFQLAARVQF